jgi:hypothetical protein
MFQLEDRAERNVTIPGDGPDYQRPSLFDMNLVVKERKVEISTRFYMPMQNNQAISSWLDLYVKTLSHVAYELASLPSCYTATFHYLKSRLMVWKHSLQSSDPAWESKGPTCEIFILVRQCKRVSFSAATLVKLLIIAFMSGKQSWLGKHPKLSALVKRTDECKSSPQICDSTIEPFSLVGWDLSRDEIHRQVGSHCGIDTTDVEDVFPCTPLQAGLLAETIRCAHHNVLDETWMFKRHVDVRRFRTSWQRVIRANPILRTRIVDIAQNGLFQGFVSYERCEIENKLPAREFGLGMPLVTYTISEHGFSWKIHHALYDAWSRHSSSSF